MSEAVLTALVVFGVFYGMAVIWAGLDVAMQVTDGDRASRRGLIWIALGMPIGWLWRGGIHVAAFLADGLLPPERRPRAPRHELEERITQLERELEIDDREENRV